MYSKNNFKTAKKKLIQDLKFFLLISFASALLITNVYAEDFEINHADSLEVGENSLNIKGNIKIKYKEALIEAPSGNIETDKEGHPTKAIFSGRAKLELAGKKLEADKITISINESTIFAEGNTKAELKDKKGIPIYINSDNQQISWNGENTKANGNVIAVYNDTKVNSDEGTIIYKLKKPYQAIFYGLSKKACLEQPNNKTKANQFTLNINTQDLKANGKVESIIWPDTQKSRENQEPIKVDTDELYIDNKSKTITASSNNTLTEPVRVNYQVTNGKSNTAILLRDKQNGKPEKIIFKGKAQVKQEDKELSSEEIVFNFEDKKLRSNSSETSRPKTIIFKK